MKYTLLSVKQSRDTIETEVAYEFDDGSKATVLVPHFQPLTVEDVIASIENRYATEDHKAIAEKRCAGLVEQLRDLLPKGDEVPIEIPAVVK